MDVFQPNILFIASKVEKYCINYIILSHGSKMISSSFHAYGRNFEVITVFITSSPIQALLIYRILGSVLYTESYQVRGTVTCRLDLTQSCYIDVHAQRMHLY